jgi:hypothetical protein
MPLWPNPVTVTALQATFSEPHTRRIIDGCSASDEMPASLLEPSKVAGNIFGNTQNNTGTNPPPHQTARKFDNTQHSKSIVHAQKIIRRQLCGRNARPTLPPNPGVSSDIRTRPRL